MTKWRRSDEELFCLDPSYKPIVDTRQQLDQDLKIADGQFPEEDLYVKIGTVDWGEIDKEIAEAMEGSDDEESDDEDDDWPDLDQEIEEEMNSMSDKDGGETVLGKRKFTS